MVKKLTVDVLATYIHNLDPFLIRFPEGWGIPGVRWYGVCYVLGFFVAAWLLKLYRNHGKSLLNEAQESHFFVALILGVLLGGRLGYCLMYDTAAFFAKPTILFELQAGGIAGMSSHGGFIGVGLAILWTAWRYKKNAWSLADIVVSIAPPGLFFGRLANFINGELWGKVTQVPWGVIFPNSASIYTPLELIPARHPSQLYEAGLEGLVLGLYLQWRFWKTQPKPGILLAEFLMLYSIFRIFVECFRQPDASLIMGLSRGSFYSLFTLAAGSLLWIYRQRCKTP